MPEMKRKYSCDPTIWNGSAFGLYQIAKAARIHRNRPTPKAEILGLKSLNKNNESYKLPLVLQISESKPIVPNTKHLCPMCSKTFSRKDSVYKHQRTACVMNIDSRYNKKAKAFRCEQCHKSFGLKKNLRQHMKNKHSESVEI